MTHPAHHHTYNRDPIMEDEGFSLRFGDPIDIIHNTQKREPESFEPSHEPSLIIPTIANSPENDITVNKNNQGGGGSISHIAASAIRDTSSIADFYHQKDGTVNENDH
ncbi:unnamed protein product [Cunninghamella blakesleeana]